MEEQDELILAAVQALEVLGDDKAMKIAATVLRGILRLSKAEQARIALLGAGIPIKLASELAGDIRMIETLKQLATGKISLN
ncbi:hypothetical protein [Arsenicibacter rosenii]|uniref:Uncharacterized protein n=1 Tax=Arsenicibacter rosenii TaxID=1750698 RepID=A0A1S2VEY4_9BACT|nr:hypothetical protein [Arsenicibacter rosenii]OIN57269.1 hypothetical protein BLX24_20000 [Arsenicibacter rosenii]